MNWEVPAVFRGWSLAIWWSFWTNSVQFQPNLLSFRGRIHQIFNLTKIEKIFVLLQFFPLSLPFASFFFHLGIPRHVLVMWQVLGVCNMLLGVLWDPWYSKHRRLWVQNMTRWRKRGKGQSGEKKQAVLFKLPTITTMCTYNVGEIKGF
jgi:hypothetical protein